MISLRIMHTLNNSVAKSAENSVYRIVNRPLLNTVQNSVTGFVQNYIYFSVKTPSWLSIEDSMFYLSYDYFK